MNRIQLSLLLCLAIVCVLITHGVESKKRVRNETSVENQGGKKFVIMGTIVTVGLVMKVSALLIGSSSLAMGITNRVYASGAKGTAAERFAQVRERDEGLWIALNDRLTEIYKGIKSHTLFALLNTEWNKEVFACDALHKLGKEILDLKKEGDQDDKIKILATKILKGKDEFGEKVPKLRGGVKQTLERIDQLFRGNRDIFGTQDSIILVFVNALEKKSPFLMRDALRFIGNFFQVEKKCVDAWIVATPELPEMAHLGVNEKAFNKTRDSQMEYINKLFDNPALAAFRWLPATSSAIPADSNIIRGTFGSPVCGVEKNGKSYIGVVGHENKCVYTIDGASSRRSATMYLLYNSCSEFQPKMSKKSSERMIPSMDRKSVICKDWKINNDDKIFHEGYGNGNITDGQCKCGHEMLDESIWGDEWDMSATNRATRAVWTSQCNVRELFNKQFAPVGFKIE